MEKSLDERTRTEPISVDAESARRMALNEDINPRETVYGEATNNVNPLTGKPYFHSSQSLPYDASVLERLHQSQLNEEVQATNTTNPITGRPYYAEGRRFKLSRKEHLFDIYSLNLDGSNVQTILQETTTDFLELQKILGRMGVRDHIGTETEYRSRREYDSFLTNLRQLAVKYSEAGLTLESITDVVGLEAALKAQDRELELRALETRLGFKNLFQKSTEETIKNYSNYSSLDMNRKKPAENINPDFIPEEIKDTGKIFFELKP